MIYEMWCSIADEEISRISQNKSCFNICNTNLEFFLKIIKFHYINRSPQKEKNFPDKWNLAKSASVLLAELSYCTDERTIIFVFDFIKEFINHENSNGYLISTMCSLLDRKNEMIFVPVLQYIGSILVSDDKRIADKIVLNGSLDKVAEITYSSS